MKEFSIGTDPEFFIEKEGQIISSIGLIGGTKVKPRVLGLCSVHEDNVCLEINVNPSTSKKEFVDTIKGAFKEITENFPSYKINNSSYHVFNDNDLLHAESIEAGCSSDYNAFSMSANTPPDLSKTKNRSAGGHIHLGLPETNISSISNIVLMMDVFLGVPSVIMDSNTERRNLYGKASCFRWKDYGLEYRTLSNFWLFSDDLIEWAYNGSKKAIEMAQTFDFKMSEDGVKMINQAIDIINNSKVDEAISFCKKFSIKYL